MRNHHPDCECKPVGLGKPFTGIEVIGEAANIGAENERPRTAGYLVLQIGIKTQSSIPSRSSSSGASLRSTGLAG